MEIGPKTEVYEYSILVTSLDEELVSLGQLYRDRADSENIFDELKNQWGWGGFVTQDIARRQLAARLVALFTIGGTSLSASSIQSVIGKQLPASMAVACDREPRKACAPQRVFLHGLMKNAERLTGPHRWRLIPSEAFKMFLKGRRLRSPPRLAPGRSYQGREFEANCRF